MSSALRTRYYLSYSLGIFALVALHGHYVSAQVRKNLRPHDQAVQSLVRNIENMEGDLNRMNASRNVQEILHLQELKKLSVLAPDDRNRASSERLHEILKAFDSFSQDRRYSSIFGLSSFKMTHSGLQSLVASLPKQEAVQDAKRSSDQPRVIIPDRLAGKREKEGMRLPQIAHVRTPPGSVPCLISRAPRLSGAERRDVLLALDALQRNVFTRADGIRLRQSYPFTELQSLVSTPKLEVASLHRLATLLSELNTLSLDPSHLGSMRNESVVQLHNHLRDLVDLSNLEIPKLALKPANDLAAVELYGTVDHMKSAKWTLRVHVIVCADDNGQRKSVMTKAQIQQGVAMANKVFESAQLRFVFDPEKDWEELRNTKINSWDLVDHDKNAAAYAGKPALQSKIVFFSAFGPDAKTANGWAANGGTHIWIPTNGIDPAGLCHEMGHFLGHLYHTFPGDGSELVYGSDPSQITAANVDTLIANFIYDSSRNKSGSTTEKAMDGDGFSDTPPDPGADYWGAKWPDKVCDPGFPTATIPNPKGGAAWVFTPDRSNLLSYFFRCPTQPTITTQQTAAILGRLEGTVPQTDNRDLTRLIKGQTPWSSTFGELIIVGKVRNVGSSTSTGGRTAVIESVGDAQTGNVPLGPPVTIGPLAPNDWVLVKVPMPGGLSWKGKACLRINPGDENPANDTLLPEPYKAPVVK